MSVKNVPDFKRDSGLWAKTVQIDGRSIPTKAFRTWNDMICRGDWTGSHQKRFPSYKGVTVCEEWKEFQNFADWYVEQIGYGLEGYQLDKDILKPGNQLYSPETCCLVPKGLNMFFVSLVPSRIRKYMGVEQQKSGAFKATLSILGKPTHLGSFKTREEAFNKFMEAKTQEARRWFTEANTGNIQISPSVMSILKSWSFRQHCFDIGLPEIAT